MKKYIYDGKTKEEALSKALNELNLTEENVIQNVLEEKNGLLKKSVKLEIININDVISYIKETIEELTKLMNIATNIELKRRENNITVTLFSNNNAILIGKNGKTLAAIQTIIRQAVSSKVNSQLQIIVDVENYKEKRIKNLERLAKTLANDVKKTKVEVALEPMNSYERRAIHNALSNHKYVYTESTGEEPNRYVIIKPKEE